MRDNPAHITPYRIAIVTLDSHNARPCERALENMCVDYPGLEVDIFAAATWSDNPNEFDKAKEAIERADLIVANLLFLEEHVKPLLPVIEARRDHCDAVVGIICDAALVKQTRMGSLDMQAPESGTMALLKRLRGSSKPSTETGEKKMRMLRRLPKILKYIPGKAQDLRAWFLCMQYWLGGTDENIEAMLRFLISRYAGVSEWRGGTVASPIEYPDVGLYHPDLADRITVDPNALPVVESPIGRVGLLLMRSYVLSGDTAHYDAVIREFEKKNIQVVPAFAGGLDGRPAIDGFFVKNGIANIDAMVSLSGFSLVGGPAYNNTDAAVETLKHLDIPYVAAHPLEFQTLSQWSNSRVGLGPIETTMLIALPELDGATNPTVFAGRHGDGGGCNGCHFNCVAQEKRAMAPCYERIEALVDRSRKLVLLKKSECASRKVAIVLFGFPPNAGAAGTAAYLDVFQSLHNTMKAMALAGYNLEVPDKVEDLRQLVLEGNSTSFGQDANVHARVSADWIVKNTPWLSDVEDQWGSAPGKIQSDGSSVLVLGKQFGNVFVGVQPTFGYEGDPMRLLFEGGFAPTHAFSAFYQWLKRDFDADVILHFGMHGALEFMPGKQVGVNGSDWPDRLIGDLPNVYLYACNNPSEASLAKRRSNAVTITHLTPPVAAAGLYKGLLDLKDSLIRWREMALDDPLRDELETLIKEQADAVDFAEADLEDLWMKLLETEDALVPEGLHVVGRSLSNEQRQSYVDAVEHLAPEAKAELFDKLGQNQEIDAILNALDGRFTPPVAGGDIVRSTDILPTGRNIHAFDPFRMPTAFACRQGAYQAQMLLDKHSCLPKTVALVLWGSDNIKSDGAQIAQALALMGAKPRFDSFGRLSGADLIPIADLGRPRIDVIMTLSGIFRDLLPLQTRMLAEAAYKAAIAEEDPAQNFVRANVLAHMEKTGEDIETAALRIFSNAEGAYGSNVNQLVDSSVFESEDELADAYEARKSFAYGRNGKPVQNQKLLKDMLSKVELAYQNLESVELGITTVDHYFDTLGGITRAVNRARDEGEVAVYISDHTKGTGKVRTLADQVALETRSRSLNPKFYEALLDHGAEGVRQLEAHVSNTLGWSATTGQVDPWVYQRISETFVLDDEMRERLAALNPTASSRMANRLLEATDRQYWTPDPETIAALQNAADALEDRMEGIAAQ
ncbi:MAG: magnesium chelatase subunit H [Rhodobacteraceae bacterium]|nr:magnesium chelatase subunit H [Paracoccaceae bacterium]